MTYPTRLNGEQVKEIAKVVNNNCWGWSVIIETARNVTLENGLKLYTETQLNLVAVEYRARIANLETAFKDTIKHLEECAEGCEYSEETDVRIQIAWDVLRAQE